MRNNDDIYFPTSWEEIKPKEFILIMSAYYIVTHNGYDIADFNRFVTSAILNIRKYKPVDDNYNELWFLDKLSQTLDWMWEETDGQASLRIDTTKNLLPKIGKLYGWRDHGSDLTFKEFRCAVTVVNDMASDKEHAEKLLPVLCGILYRERDSKGRKTPFDELRIDEYVAAVNNNIPLPVQVGIYLQFAYFCKYLRTEEFVLNGNTVTFEPLFPEGERAESEGQNIGMASILYSVAESGVFGTAKEVDNTSLLMVLLKLLNDKQRYDELMKLYNK